MPSNHHCYHVKVDGTYYQSPPLHERHYCHFHLLALGRRMRMARERARRERHHLVLPLLEDMNAVQVGLMQVMDALAAGQLEEKRAGLLLYGLQQAASNLNSLTAAPRLGVYDESDKTPRAEACPGFEQLFDLPKDLDLSKPPEVVFPPAATAAPTTEAGPSPYRSNPWHEVNPEDIELEEILLTQDEEAYQKRRDGLQVKAWRQIERERRQVAEARHIVEAARRNGRQWSAYKLKEHYEKLWAEAAAKEKKDKEEIEALRAAAFAEARAKKASESAPASEQASPEGEKTGS